MFLLTTINTTTLTAFKLSISDLRKIPIKSYIRKGKLVKRSNRLIKKPKLKVVNNDTTNNLKPTNALTTKLTNNTKLNYYNTEYSNRLNVIQKEEINKWSKQLNNMNTKQLDDITDWDDSVSVLEFIEEDIKKNPNSFRSVSYEGKMMSMATVEEDKINKCLKVKNLLSNPERLNNVDKKPYGAGTTSIIHMIEESISLGYEGKLKLTALPKASKFYEKLGFKRIGSEYQYQYILESDKAQYLLDSHLNTFNSKLTEFSVDKNIVEAMKLEKDIIAFAISKLK